MYYRNDKCYLRYKSDGQKYLFGEDGDDNILKPLIQTGGLFFTYRPTVVFGSTVNYTSTQFTHTNYPYRSYSNTDVSEITINADFAAQTESEARYLLAVMHFLKSSTKSYFGESNDLAGTPPPTMLFNYLGEHNFKDVPVLISSYMYTLDNDIDYIYISDLSTHVPTFISIAIGLQVNYNPSTVRKEFDLDKFREGKLLGKGFI